MRPALEFIGVTTGWLVGKTHAVPAANAQIDDADRSIKVPYSQDQIKDAPSFAKDAELSPEDEEQISSSFYGIDRSTGPSPSGLPTRGRRPAPQAMSAPTKSGCDSMRRSCRWTSAP